MRQFIYLLIILLSPISLFSQSAGNGKSWLLSSSSEAKAAKRFSLQEWMENKDRRALMDMWLSINTPSPYEFMIGIGQAHYDTNSTTQQITQTTSTGAFDGEMHAYAKYVGVSAQYTNNTELGFNDLTGQFNLRLFGVSTQSTNITLHYGLRTRTANDGSYRLNQLYPAATFQIYLTRYFGLYSNYKYFMPYSESFWGDTKGDELTAGIFIEYGIIRLFGNYYNERQNSILNNIETQIDRKGTKVGLQFHF